MSRLQEDADWLATWRRRYLNEPELHAFVEVMLIEDRRKRDAEIERLRAALETIVLLSPSDFGADGVYRLGKVAQRIAAEALADQGGEL